MRKLDHAWEFRLLEAFRRYQSQHGAPPTHAELSLALKQVYGRGAPSVFGVNRLLRRLVAYGYIRKEPGTTRIYRLTVSGQEAQLADFPTGAEDVRADGD